MKQLLIIIGFLFSSHFILANDFDVQSTKDTIPTKLRSYGIQASSFINGNKGFSQHIGFSAESNFTKSIAIEAILSYSNFKGRFPSQKEQAYESHNIEILAGPKFYFGKEKLWYARLGIYRRFNLSSNVLDLKLKGSRYEIGVGRQFILKNNRKLKFEGLLRHDELHRLQAGIRFGFIF